MRYIKKRPGNSSSRGDTLVEVLFATATAALLIVITLVLMNRNLAQIQMSVETTFVRQAIDSQAEVLRYMRDQYMADKGADPKPDPVTGVPTIPVAKLWRDLVDLSPSGRGQVSATNFGTCQPDSGGAVNPPASGKAFFINTSASAEAEGDAANVRNIKQYDTGTALLKDITGTSVSATYARPGQGLWIESVSPDFDDTQPNRYVDFHIRACWDPPFNGSKATLGTIVRLYYETPTGSQTPGFVTFCSDTIDNDGDGLNNSDDPGCHSDSDASNPASYVASDNNERDPPSISLSANPLSLIYPPGPNNSRVTWSNPDGTAVSCTSPNFPAPFNPPPSSGFFDTGTLTANKVYTITCSNNIAETNTRSVAIAVDPPPPDPATISPTSHGFPAWHMFAEVGAKQTKTFTVTNPSPYSSLNITTTPISGANASSFSVTSNGCASTTLGVGASCNITVQFFPPSGPSNNRLSNAGNKTAALTINNSNGVAATSASFSGHAVSDRMGPNDIMWSAAETSDPARYSIRAYSPACANSALSCSAGLFLWGDGNLALYPDVTVNSAPYVTGATGANRMIMQASDGNLVMYRPDNTAILYTGARGAGVWLQLFSNADLWMMNPDWQSSSSGNVRIYP